LTISLPQDWNFNAAKGKILATGPNGGLGFIFNAYAGNPMPIMHNATIMQGVIASRYLMPAQTLPFVMHGYGHHNAVVLSSTPDQNTMAQCRAQLRGGSCDAADMVATWTSKGGVDCVGGFKVMNIRPGVTGQWSSIVAGIWGPRKELSRYLSMLERVANSFSISDQYARNYILSGLANLKALEAQTSAEIRSLNYTREDLQRAWEQRQARHDYMESKWDDYRRGNSYWVSDLEGGKVYATDTWGTKDTVTGDYYEGKAYNYTYFEGQNPRYPSEDMREVSSWEVEHGLAPPPR
jgi:hypothetical protein